MQDFGSMERLRDRLTGASYACFWSYNKLPKAFIVFFFPSFLHLIPLKTGRIIDTCTDADRWWHFMKKFEPSCIVCTSTKTRNYFLCEQKNRLVSITKKFWAVLKAVGSSLGTGKDQEISDKFNLCLFHHYTHMWIFINAWKLFFLYGCQTYLVLN